MNLRAWLRKTPQPSRVRITCEDESQREIALTDDLRGRWKTCEEAVYAARATSIEALDDRGNILRGERLSLEGDDGDFADPEEREERYAKKIVASERKELASVLESQGRAIVKAYEAGADAAGASQEKLVQLVEVLTHHLANAISNLHKISVQFAEVVQGEEAKKETSGLDNMVQQVVGMAAAKAMSAAAEPPKANGKGK